MAKYVRRTIMVKVGSSADTKKKRKARRTGGLVGAFGIRMPRF